MTDNVINATGTSEQTWDIGDGSGQNKLTIDASGLLEAKSLLLSSTTGPTLILTTSAPYFEIRGDATIGNIRIISGDGTNGIVVDNASIQLFGDNVVDLAAPYVRILPTYSFSVQTGTGTAFAIDSNNTWYLNGTTYSPPDGDPGTSGQVLTSGGPGATVTWEDAGGSLPSMTDKQQQFLTNDGTDANWSPITNIVYSCGSIFSQTLEPGQVGAGVTGDSFASGDLTITSQRTLYTVGASSAGSDPGQTAASAYAKAQAINDIGIPYVFASAQTALEIIFVTTSTNGYGLSINGTDIYVSENAPIILADFIDEINLNTSTTQVSAYSPTSSVLRIIAEDGRNIVIAQTATATEGLQAATANNNVYNAALTGAAGTALMNVRGNVIISSPVAYDIAGNSPVKAGWTAGSFPFLAIPGGNPGGAAVQYNGGTGQFTGDDANFLYFGSGYLYLGGSGIVSGGTFTLGASILSGKDGPTPDSNFLVRAGDPSAFSGDNGGTLTLRGGNDDSGGSAPGKIVFKTANTERASFDRYGNLTTKNGISTQGYQYETPGTGDTVTMTNNLPGLVLDPTGSLLSLTVELPDAPLDGQTIFITTTQSIVSFSIDGNGNSVVGDPSTINADSPISLIYIFAITTWVRK